MTPFGKRVFSWRAFRPFVILLAAFSFLMGIATNATAQDGRKVALVIGNGNYNDLGRLNNPPNDARDMATALRSIGFEVDTVIDGSLRQMEQAVVRMSDRLSSGTDTTGFFFYAGHGVQSDGTNYLIPAGASIPSEDFLSERALSAQVVLNIMQRAGNDLNVVVLDACRDNPFSWSRSGTRGLSAVSSQPPGSIIAYATSAGSTAQDGTGRNGVFTAELLKHITEPGVDIDDVFDLTAQGVMEQTGNRQIPAVYKQFFGSAYLAGAGGPSGGSNGVSSTPAARAPSLTSVATYGSVRISAATAGTIYLDGDRLGSVSAGSAAVVNDVETGSRSIEIRYADGERESSRVTVREGATARASFSYVERPATPDYSIGDRGPAGGWIFYDKGTTSDGWRYLEAAPSDLDVRMKWDDAVDATRGYTAGGYSDWRLPSKDELNWMYENLHEEGIGGFAGYDPYWSSSEDYSYGVWSQYFGNGSQSTKGRYDNARVRAIRAF